MTGDNKTAPPKRGADWGHLLVVAVRWMILIVLWAVQYMIWVPLVIAWHAILFGLGFGILGVLLVFIPIIGWAILAFVLLNRGGTPWLGPLVKPWRF